METRSWCREGQPLSTTCSVPQLDQGDTPARETPPKEALVGATAAVGAVTPPPALV